LFYDRFSDLCKQSGITPAKVAESIGINKSTMYMWKNQGTTPKYQTLQKLADYFGVSVDLLLGDTSDYVPDMGLPKLSSDAVQLAKDYDKLDQSGRERVRIKLECEKKELRELVSPPISHTRFTHSLGVTHIAQDIAKLISSPKARIATALDKLNEDGQEKAAERVEELTEIPRYRLQDTPEAPEEPQEPSEED